MPTETPLPMNHPTVIAWDKWKKSDPGQNSMRWAIEPEHVEGSMWAAFCAGIAATNASVGSAIEQLRTTNDRMKAALELIAQTTMVSRHHGGEIPSIAANIARQSLSPSPQEPTHE